jgi:hypothetical protein
VTSQSPQNSHPIPSFLIETFFHRCSNQVKLSYQSIPPGLTGPLHQVCHWLLRFFPECGGAEYLNYEFWDQNLITRAPVTSAVALVDSSSLHWSYYSQRPNLSGMLLARDYTQVIEGKTSDSIAVRCILRSGWISVKLLLICLQHSVSSVFLRSPTVIVSRNVAVSLRLPTMLSPEIWQFCLRFISWFDMKMSGEQ